MKCRDCKWCYNNETMGELYICVNGTSENFGDYTGYGNKYMKNTAVIVLTAEKK